ncbi:hypothetical protein [Paucihalobacter sp.]|uniref:hypothetical protein n=1 Tax=Paucihalobacter sp. TaxID=2850405 RepID=UPI003D161D43
MLEKILNLDGVVLLNKKQQQAVNGGKKCETIPNVPTQFEQDFDIHTCMVRCRPSFLGIGFGSWTIEEESVLC